MAENDIRTSTSFSELNLGLKIGDRRSVKLEKLKEICEETILDNEIDTLVRKAIVELVEKELKNKKA